MDRGINRRQFDGWLNGWIKRWIAGSTDEMAE
jgi:hypothetical protein